MRLLVAAYLGMLAFLLGAAIAGGFALSDKTGPSDGIEAVAGRYSFDLLTWELRSLPGKWVYKIGGLLEDRPSDDDAALRRYFEVADRLQELPREPGKEAERDTLEREREVLENHVEDIIEGRVTAVLEDQGLALSPPLFGSLGLVFPPVDFELDAPPRGPAVSPRERIDLDRSYLLRPGLSAETVRFIESETEAAPVTNEYPRGVSALVVTTGGVATFP